MSTYLVLYILNDRHKCTQIVLCDFLFCRLVSVRSHYKDTLAYNIELFVATENNRAMCFY